MKSLEIIKMYKADEAKRKLVSHNDLLKIDANSSMKKTDDGYLAGTAPVAKVGVMAYLMEDGTIVREFVPPETLFDEASMASLKMKPVTDKHPSDRKVDAENAGYEQVGFTGESIAKSDEVYLTTNMTVTDGWAVDHIMDGRQELSPGYEAELVFQKGDYNGDEYDAIQVSRKYNHLAIVDNARGGTDIRMQLDGADNLGFEKGVLVKNDSLNQQTKKEYSMKFNVDGIEYDADQQVVNHITRLEKSVNDAKAEAKTNKDSSDAITAERDTLKAKVDELEKRDITKEINDGVTARLELEKVAAVILDEEDKIDGLSNREVKVKIIEKKFPTIKIDEDKSDVYIEAVLDTIDVEKEDNVDDDQRKISTPKQEVTVDENDDSSEAARKKMIKDQNDAYKTDSK